MTFWKAPCLVDEAALMISHKKQKQKQTVVFGSRHPSFSPTFIAEQNTESCVRGQGHHESAFTVRDENWLYSHAKWHVC